MKASLLMLLLLFLVPAWADEAAGPASVIYRTTDANGNVVFTDNPADKSRAEPVRVRKPNTVPMSAPARPARPDAAGPPDDSPFQGYQTVAITSPVDQATLRDPRDPVAVQVNVVPALQAGHRLVLLDNGVPLDSPMLNNPDRGSHSLQVVIEDEQGARLAASDPVVVHVHRSRARQGRTGGASALGAAARLGSAAAPGTGARPGAGAKAGSAARPGQGARPASLTSKPASSAKSPTHQ